MPHSTPTSSVQYRRAVEQAKINENKRNASYALVSSDDDDDEPAQPSRLSAPQTSTSSSSGKVKKERHMR